MWKQHSQARLAQSAERKALNLVVVGSSPTVGVFPRMCPWSSWSGRWKIPVPVHKLFLALRI